MLEPRKSVPRRELNVNYFYRDLGLRLFDDDVRLVCVCVMEQKLVPLMTLQRRSCLLQKDLDASLLLLLHSTLQTPTEKPKTQRPQQGRQPSKEGENFTKKRQQRVIKLDKKSTKFKIYKD